MFVPARRRVCSILRRQSSPDGDTVPSWSARAESRFGVHHDGPHALSVALSHGPTVPLASSPTLGLAPRQAWSWATRRAQGLLWRGGSLPRTWRKPTALWSGVRHRPIPAPWQTVTVWRPTCTIRARRSRGIVTQSAFDPATEKLAGWRRCSHSCLRGAHKLRAAPMCATMGHAPPSGCEQSHSDSSSVHAEPDAA